MRPRIVFQLLAAASLAACAPKGEAQATRTEAERDSILANSSLPGAGAVKKARATQDSAKARVESESAITADE